MFFSQEEKRKAIYFYWGSTKALVCYFTHLLQHQKQLRKGGCMSLSPFHGLRNWCCKKLNSLLKALWLLSAKARILTLFYVLCSFSCSTFPLRAGESLDTVSLAQDSLLTYWWQTISVKGSSPQWFQLGWGLQTLGTSTSITQSPPPPTPSRMEQWLPMWTWVWQWLVV